MKEWFTARELADIAPPGVPKYPQDITARASREGWTARARDGRGGGSEYHISSLPAATRDALAVREAGLVLNAPSPDEGDPSAAPCPSTGDRGKNDAALRRDAAAAIVRIFERWRAADDYTTREAEERFARLWTAEAGRKGSEIVPMWIAGLVPCFSVRSLRRWRAQAQKSAARRDGRRQARSPFEADDGLRDYVTALTLKQPHLTAGHLRDLCRAAFERDDLPSIRAFQRFLNGWKRENAPAIQKICAPDDWRSHRLIAVGSASAHVERLNQVWEIDASPADMLCTDGRYIKRADIADLHHRMRRTPYDANRMLEVISKMFNLAEMWGWRDEHSNPRRHIAKYPERKRERYLTREELQRLLSTLDYAEGILEGREDQTPLIVHRSAINAFRLLAFTGCRLMEIQTLKWKYIDREHRILRLPDTKTGARAVPVSQHVIDLLTAIWSHPDTPQENEFVIYGTLPLAHLTDLQSPWRRIRKAAGLEDVRIHDLRHSFASYAVSAGHSLPMIGKLLGHTQVQTTARYAHLMTDPMHKAADDIVGNMLGG